MADMILNESDLIRCRMDYLSAFGALDAKRPTAWSVYGYPEQISFAQLRSAYERGGAGHGAVHRILEMCWQQVPRIKQPNADDETPWEAKLSKTLKAINGWSKLRDLDRRNMIGRYAALIYRMADSKPLSEPLERAARLVDLIPVYEDQIRVTAWFSDRLDSENFGKPQMFQYRARRPDGGDTQGQPDDWADVHPSRVQILAEGSVGDMFDGVPMLRAGYNSLVDIEKISGGSAESYLKNSARTIVFKYEANASPQAIAAADGSTKTVREVHEEQTRALNRNTDSSIVMQGGDATTLQTQISDPTEAFNVAANLFSASVRIPFTVLFGQQTGRLASDQDISDMQARCASRRETELTPMLEQFVRRMQSAGVVDQGEFEVEWQSLDAPGDAERYEHLAKLTAAMRGAFDAGLSEPIFDANELRAVAGYEERANDGMDGIGGEGAPPEDDE